MTSPKAVNMIQKVLLIASLLFLAGIALFYLERPRLMSANNQNQEEQIENEAARINKATQTAKELSDESQSLDIEEIGVSAEDTAKIAAHKLELAIEAQAVIDSVGPDRQLDERAFHTEKKTQLDSARLLLAAIGNNIVNGSPSYLSRQCYELSRKHLACIDSAQEEPDLRECSEYEASHFESTCEANNEKQNRDDSVRDNHPISSTLR